MGPVPGLELGVALVVAAAVGRWVTGAFVAAGWWAAGAVEFERAGLVTQRGPAVAAAVAVAVAVADAVAIANAVSWSAGVRRSLREIAGNI